VLEKGTHLPVGTRVAYHLGGERLLGRVCTREEVCRDHNVSPEQTSTSFVFVKFDKPLVDSRNILCYACSREHTDIVQEYIIRGNELLLKEYS